MHLRTRRKCLPISGKKTSMFMEWERIAAMKSVSKVFKENNFQLKSNFKDGRNEGLGRKTYSIGFPNQIKENTKSHMFFNFGIFLTITLYVLFQGITRSSRREP